MLRRFYHSLQELYYDWAETRYLKRPCELEGLTYVQETKEFGRGVFAACRIEKGTLLGIYPGYRRRKAEFFSRDAFLARSMRYSYFLHDGTVVDPTDLFGHVANKSHLRLALVNEPPLDVEVNVLPIPSRSNVWYLVRWDIEEGEQLFTNYGPKYARSYPSQMAVTKGRVGLTQEDRAMLQIAEHRYPWLQVDIENTSDSPSP